MVVIAFWSLIAHVHQIKHLHACFMTQMAHVASVTEREVVVVASLAYPVTSSLWISNGSFIIFQLFNLFEFLNYHFWSLFVWSIASCISSSDCIKCIIFFQHFDCFRFSTKVGIYLKILEFTILLHLGIGPLKFETRRCFFLLRIRLK